MSRALVIGAGGQIGVELVQTLRKIRGNDHVIASDIKPTVPAELFMGPYVQLDVLDKQLLHDYICNNEITEVYHLAALLSANAEQNPSFAWRLNMESLLTILDLAKAGYIKKLFWPSSIAVFGTETPQENTAQSTIMNPSTVYGISKLAGERWCEYYHSQYGVDVRSVRFPGLISHQALPGGGTTDYAVTIFYHAKKHQIYNCFLSDNRKLPMMYMNDAIRAIIELMEAPADRLTVRSSYNISACSFTPAELTAEICRYYPAFKTVYNPDFRDRVAASWPQSIDDQIARQDWGWKHQYGIKEIVSEMLENINELKLNE